MNENVEYGEGTILEEIKQTHTNAQMAKHIRGVLYNSKKQSPSSSPSSPPREVGVYFYLWRVHEIDTVQQRFSVTVTLSFTWVEDDPKTKIRVKLSDDYDNNNDRKAQWELKDFAWHPQMSVRNILEQDDIITEDWVRVKNSSGKYINKEQYLELYEESNSKEPLKITQFMKRKFTLSEAFELQNFPCDLQQLHIQLSSSWDCKKVVLNFNKEVPSAMDPNPLDSQEWDLHKPRLIAYDTYTETNTKYRKDELPLLSLSSQSITGAVYPKLYIALTAVRKPQYYLWNIYIMLFILGTLSFTVFNIEPEELGDRLSNMLTLVLALVAFKLVLAQSLPSISYLTMLDIFTLGAMMLMFFISVATSTLPRLDLEQDDMLFGDRVILFLGVILWGVLNVWFIVKVFTLMRARNVEIRNIDESFEKLRKMSLRV